MIKNVAILSNVGIYNANHDATYRNKDGIMVIEYTDNTKKMLDLDSMSDITDSSYLEVIINKKKTKIDYLFKNIMYDTETLNRLAKGD